MRPDISQFVQHCQKAIFQAGIDDGMWGFVDENLQGLTNPIVYLWISARPKTGKPDRYYFKFDITGYPASPPTACIWDIKLNKKLPENERPKGSKFVTLAFRHDWSNGEALYLPLDRIAQPGHEHWKTQFPNLWWSPTFTIWDYVNYVHTLLNSSDYANS
ncbi:MAG: hypothetical protein P4L41_02900 [Flavipsychrobacter sp.]|nr:hypothetical protein [Flavipsychrobacter sp.]